MHSIVLSPLRLLDLLAPLTTVYGNFVIIPFASHAILGYATSTALNLLCVGQPPSSQNIAAISSDTDSH